MWRMLGATLLWHTHIQRKKTLLNVTRGKAWMCLLTLFLPLLGCDILATLFPASYLYSDPVCIFNPLQHQFYTWLTHTHPLPKHTRHIHGNWETHGRCHKVNVHRQRKYTAIQQDMHLLHTGAEGKQTQRPWETAMCDWCEKKQIQPLMSGQYSWAKPSSHFWGKTARSVYVDAQVCVCVL